MTRPLPTSPRPSGWTRSKPSAYCSRGTAYWRRASTTRPSPTAPRPSGSTRSMPRRTAAGALPTGEKGEHDKAIADYTEAIRLDPKYAEAYYNRGSGLQLQGRDRQGHRRLHRGHPARPEGCRGVLQPGQCLLRKGRTRQGHRRLHRGHPARPEVWPRRTTTGAWPTATRASYDKAIADFTEAIRLDPKDADAYCNRARAYYSKGEYDKAIADYSEAIRLNPKYARRITVEALPIPRKVRRPKRKRISSRQRSSGTSRSRSGAVA